MAHRLRLAFTCVAVVGAALIGSASAVADPTDPAPTPVTFVPDAPPPPVSNNPMTPGQPPVPAGAPVPSAQPATAPGPTVPNTVPPPGNSGGGGILGSLVDMWHQARNPFAPPGGPAAPGAVPAVPPGAGPAPKLPPGYVSINAPGSETPSTGPAGGSPADRPPLPPGYYSLDGPPPPWLTGPAAAPAPPAPGS